MQLPPGLVALVRLLPRLLFTPATVYITLRKTVREAARRGAILPPSIKYRWPGALDKLSVLLWNYSNGYLGMQPLAEYIQSECEEIGNTFDLYAMCESRIVTIEPEYVKIIRRTESICKGPVFRDQFDSILGTGVFNSDGEFHRTMTRPFFSRDRISDFDIFETHAEDAIHQMKMRMRQGYPVDFQDVASRFTLDSATEFLFGKDVCSLSAGIVYPPSSPLSKDPAFLNHPSNRFVRAFTASQIATMRRANYGSCWRLAEFWQDQVQKHMRVCYEFVDPIIADTLAKKHEQGHIGLDDKQDTGEVNEGETLLEHLVNYTEDQTILRDETLNLLIAGRDTTAATLTFSVYMLSQHPDVLARLREELITKIGLSRRPTHDDMRELKYLRAFINEVLRLYPPVPFNTRTVYSVFLMHRRKDLWGPDADQFDPDRFLDERLHKYLTPNPFLFLPFNAGPRICLGQQFAYHEISYFLIRLLQSIDGVALDVGTQRLAPPEWAGAEGRKALEKVVLRFHLSMYVQDGLWVKMKEAD
ncbi:cytochrome P450 [Boletus edulis]|nr:cytochrome P450 [Boletus edulis]